MKQLCLLAAFIACSSSAMEEQPKDTNAKVVASVEFDCSQSHISHPGFRCGCCAHMLNTIIPNGYLNVQGFIPDISFGDEFPLHQLYKGILKIHKETNTVTNPSDHIKLYQDGSSTFEGLEAVKKPLCNLVLPPLKKVIALQKAYAYTQLTWDEFGSTDFLVHYKDIVRPFRLLSINGYSAFNQKIDTLQKELVIATDTMHQTFVQKNDIKKTSPSSLRQLWRKNITTPQNVGLQSYKKFHNKPTEYIGKEDLKKEFRELSEGLFKKCDAFREEQLKVIQITEERERKEKRRQERERELFIED